MNKFTTAILVPIALLCASCSTVIPAVLTGFDPVGGAALTLTLKDEKALYAAEAGFKGVSIGLNSAVDSGLLKGERAGTAKKYYDRAYEALKVARTAYSAGNAQSLGEQVAIAMGAIADLQAMLAPSPTS